MAISLTFAHKQTIAIDKGKIKDKVVKISRINKQRYNTIKMVIILHVAFIY